MSAESSKSDYDDEEPSQARQKARKQLTAAQVSLIGGNTVRLNVSGNVDLDVGLDLSLDENGNSQNGQVVKSKASNTLNKSVKVEAHKDDDFKKEDEDDEYEYYYEDEDEQDGEEYEDDDEYEDEDEEDYQEPVQKRVETKRQVIQKHVVDNKQVVEQRVCEQRSNEKIVTKPSRPISVALNTYLAMGEDLLKSGKSGDYDSLIMMAKQDKRFCDEDIDELVMLRERYRP